MYDKISKFLRIFFMCHCRADRSFFYKGRQFPVCARCTGELIGMIFAIPIAFKVKDLSWLYIILLSLPLILDGFIQLLTKYESNNFKRVVTGFLFGIAFIFILLKFHYFAVEIALKIVSIIQPDNPALEKYENFLK